MKYEFKKTFTTGEFAKEFGIKKDTLFYYDKIGLFKPAGIYENGYRFYTLDQFDTFWAIQSLRIADIPISTLQEYFTNPSLNSLQTLAHNQLQTLKTEINQLLNTKYYLEQVTNTINEITTATFDTVLYKQFNDAPVKYSQDGIKYDDSIEKITQVYEGFMEDLEIKGLASIGIVIPLEFLRKNEGNFNSPLFFRSQQSEDVIPAGQYAVYYHKGSDDNFERLYNKIIDKVLLDGYLLDGPLFEEYLLHSLSTGREEDYVTKFFVKIKKNF